MNQYAKQILKWLLISGILTFSVLAIIFANGAKDAGGTISQVVLGNEWIKGNPDSNIVIVEYSDFQCPACANYEPILKQVLGEFDNHVKFVYRHFPLSIHPNSSLAAQASEAAGIQGKFWEMHEMLFTNQGTWSIMSQAEVEQEFISYSQKLELDTELFKKDIVSEAVVKAVMDDYKSGQDSGVDSTPSFFLNGERINNPRSVEEFRTLIRTTIEKDNS